MGYKVAVIGAKGRMGSAICKALETSADLELVAALDREDSLDKASFNSAEVVIEFSHPDFSLDHVQAALAAGCDVVVGTSGWKAESTARVKEILKGTQQRVLVVPNFAISAVLAMRFAKEAARYFESAEVIELHHPQKADAPSGTAAHTAQMIAHARREAGLDKCPDATTLDELGCRGGQVEEVHVHSIRMRGMMASQEAIFGNEGEVLTIRTDTFDRSCYMPGVLLAARGISQLPIGIHFGLEMVMG
ncbi:4-hydroxy-tetrahydrodipicolinate reductase [Actinomycetaceae bacterium TAE3-ERU4]|nr:4-hydroxy-tetrahydrodipicolinate reductase [Actinomycetaceae bacterium TAE3-ERU4]